MLVVLGAHLAIANMPKDAFIFDEAFYVPAARCLLTGEVCNVEHPPLAKALIALSIRYLRDEGFAWRLPSIIMGTLAIVFVYSLTRRLRDRKTALLAAFLLSFESLWFTHSSIAMLDIVAVSLGLLALLLFVRGEWVWAGAIIGLSMLAKEITILLIGILPLFTLLQSPKALSRPALRQAGRVAFFVAVSAGVVFMTGLQIYDSLSHAFPTAFAHVARMIRHNRAIAAPPLSDAVQPFQWFSGFTPSAVLRHLRRHQQGRQTDVRPGPRPAESRHPAPRVAGAAVLASGRAAQGPERDASRPAGPRAARLLPGPRPVADYVPLLHARVPAEHLRAVRDVPRGAPAGVILAYGLGVVMWFLAWFPRNLLTLSAR